MSGISVVMCCYNSASKISLALEYLAKQRTTAELNWELILVDNNSSDDTVAVAKSVWKSFSCKADMCVITEQKPGLSNAREAGVKAAANDIILFCDDDNLLEENYLQYGFELANKTFKTGYAIWGGKAVAHFDAGVNIPDWFEKEKGNYVVGEQAPATGDISGRGYVWGAGMIILKRIFQKIINANFPLLLTGRNGSVLTSGDDSEISLRTIITNHKLYYDENLVLKHYIPKYKLTQAYNEGLINGFTASNTILNKYKIFIHYISGKDLFARTWYSAAYLFKYLLSRLHIKELTEHDLTVLHALFSKDYFRDKDFELMHALFENRNQLQPVTLN